MPQLCKDKWDKELEAGEICICFALTTPLARDEMILLQGPLRTNQINLFYSWERLRYSPRTYYVVYVNHDSRFISTPRSFQTLHVIYNKVQVASKFEDDLYHFEPQRWRSTIRDSYLFKRDSLLLSNTIRASEIDSKAIFLNSIDSAFYYVCVICFSDIPLITSTFIHGAKWNRV